MTAAICSSGCYSPHPPSGAYQCGAGNACPSSQHCVCGLCVNQDSDGACSFQVALTVPQTPPLSSCPAPSASGPALPVVNEHQTFSVAIQALAPNGQPSTFSGTVALSSTWGDVSPQSVALANGAATVQVTLNREVVPPQSAKIVVKAGTTSSESQPICVQAPRFTFDAPVVSPFTQFGFADSVEDASVTKTSSGWRMYYVGKSVAVPKQSIGVATSTDGMHFTATGTTPALRAADVSFGKEALYSPTLWNHDGSASLLFQAQQTAGFGAPSTIGIADGDELGPFTNPRQLITSADCPTYCGTSVNTPSIAYDTASADGGASDAATESAPPMLFFGAQQGAAFGIGRADAVNGVFVLQQGTVLTGDFAGEAFLTTPRVWVDGHVYKMWYTFARTDKLVAPGINALCDPKNMDAVQVGYATSADGLFWIRSPSNPVFKPSDVPLGTVNPGASVQVTYALNIVGSIIPTDGESANAGMAMYFTPVFNLTASGLLLGCVGSGVLHATRP